MRVYFRRSARRFVRGGLIIDMQRALTRAGAPTSLDGVFGTDTEAALKRWQTSAGLTASGEADEPTWTRLTGDGPPSLFRRALAVTAAFEGHGYGRAAGNFDDAFVTWGLIGFTLRHGSLGEVIRRCDARHPRLLNRRMGAEKAGELREIVAAPQEAQRAWADGISTGSSKAGLRTDWADAFEQLGQARNCRAIQDELARERYWSIALRDIARHGEMTELDAALFFDTAVQNGGVDTTKAGLIRDALAAAGPTTGAARRRIIATAIADGSNPTWREDVLSRRMAIAVGEGAVHGAGYTLADWGLADLPVMQEQLEA